MLHRRVNSSENIQLLRTVTIHQLNGLKLDENREILASFNENIKLTHKGKTLQVKYLVVSFYSVK